jgi:endoglucanase
VVVAAGAGLDGAGEALAAAGVVFGVAVFAGERLAGDALDVTGGADGFLAAVLGLGGTISAGEASDDTGGSATASGAGVGAAGSGSAGAGGALSGAGAGCSGGAGAGSGSGAAAGSAGGGGDGGESGFCSGERMPGSGWKLDGGEKVCDAGHGGHSRRSLAATTAASPAAVVFDAELRLRVPVGVVGCRFTCSKRPMRFATLARGRSSGRGLGMRVRWELWTRVIRRRT